MDMSTLLIAIVTVLSFLFSGCAYQPMYSPYAQGVVIEQPVMYRVHAVPFNERHRY
jgi:hypothetical protein